MNRLNQIWQEYDKILLTTVLLISIVGLVMLYSASSYWAYSQYDTGSYFLEKQIVRLMVGFLVMYAFMLLDYRRLKDWANIIMIGSIFLLLATKISFILKGDNSPARWIYLGPLSLQTSDIARITLIIYLSAYIGKKSKQLHDFYNGFLPAVIVIAVMLAMIAIQPDFSSAAIIGLIGFTILFLGGAKVPQMMATASVGGTLMALYMMLEPYRRARIFSYLNPSANSAGADYQAQQSLISLGNGGFMGMGLGNSMEKNLFLPTPHTDFIFSIIGEEIGFIGATFILLLFLAVFLRGVKIAKEAADPFGILLALGISFSFIIYAFINAAIATKLVPTTGLPMPLISYGGSALVINLASIGILLNISRKNRPSLKPSRIFH